MHLKRGVRLGRPFGIPLVVHASWFPAALLLMVHFAATAYPDRGPVAAPALGTATALAFFASLVAHEFGHALAARTLGIPVVDVTLFVFGGVARIGREPTRPAQETFIASAGPLVSALLGIAMVSSSTGDGFLRTLGLCNLALAVFNLLPGFPLDGGRLLRAWLWARTGRRHGSALVAGRLGQLIGGALAGTGIATGILLGAPLEGIWLTVVGTFLAVLATSARRAARVAARFDAERAGDFVRPFAGTVRPDDPVSVPGPYAVALDGRLTGVVPSALSGALALELMVPWTARLSVHESQPLTRALERLAAESSGLLVVVDDLGTAIGVLDHGSVRERLATV